MAQGQNPPAGGAPVQPKPAKSNLLLIFLIIGSILVFLGLVAGGGYLLYKKFFKKSTSTASLTIPENCPKNIPIYPKSKVVSITCKPEASSIESVVNIDSKKVKSWYREEVPKAGWTIRAEDTASYLFDNNNNEIGKVSLSAEKKNTMIKFLVAKKTAQAPVTAKKSSGASGISSSDPFAPFADALVNWDDYFNSIAPDESLPTDEYFPPDESQPTDEYQPPEEATEVPTEEAAPPEDTSTPEPELTEEPTDEPTAHCWVDDKGGEHCD